jgi:hypothetical protein
MKSTTPNPVSKIHFNAEGFQVGLSSSDYAIKTFSPFKDLSHIHISYWLVDRRLIIQGNLLKLHDNLLQTLKTYHCKQVDILHTTSFKTLLDFFCFLHFILVVSHLWASLTATNTHVGGQPSEVRGGRGSDIAQGVLLPPCPFHIPFPSYYDIAQARRYFASSANETTYLTWAVTIILKWHQREIARGLHKARWDAYDLRV